VLFRLAELGVLRKVEVISSVSGGSVIAALYYLHAKRLLDTTEDDNLTDADFVDALQTIKRDFLEFTRKNPRALATANLAKTIYMAISPTYSRTSRIGDLLDYHLYRPAFEANPTEPERPRRYWDLLATPLKLRELRIHPPGTDKSFRPDKHNARRKHKVPILLLNATTLDTGHAFRFEAIRMGERLPQDEHALEVAQDSDKNDRLAEGYFEPDLAADPPHKAIRDKQRDFPLGLAVAASAAVPPLFAPQGIAGLYDGWRVELSDGGVHDNQGIQALFDTTCEHLIVSDASGQMQDDKNPGNRIISVAKRSSSIYGDSIRDEQLAHAGALGKPVAVMHLRKGLIADTVWPLAEDGTRVVEDVPYDATEVLSGDFGVSGLVQEKLAYIRTDLDSFTDIEAFSLMLDGYRMTEYEVKAKLMELVETTPFADPDPSRWGLQDAVTYMTPAANPPAKAYLRRLDAAKSRFPRITPYAVLAVLGVGAYFLWDGIGSGDARGHDIYLGVLVAVAVAVSYVLERPRLPIPLVPINWAMRFVGGVLLPLAVAPVLFVVSLVTLFFNRFKLWWGRFARL